MAATSGRRLKIAEISGLLCRAAPGEVPLVVAFLSGELRQRQIGVGYAALAELLRQPTPPPAAEGRAAEAPAGGAGTAEAPAGDAVRVLVPQEHGHDEEHDRDERAVGHDSQPGRNGAIPCERS